jgi:aminoglycoside phosphotransferase (APT) family kinase protein
MSREFRLLSSLHTSYGRAPRAVAFCDDVAVLDAPFYVMEAVEGVILRRTAPDGLAFDGQHQTALWESFVRELATIHAVDLNAAGLTDFGKPSGYIRRQVEGWTARYRRSETDRIEAIDQVVAWLDANIPDELPASLLHNDYKLDNLVLDPGDASRIIGVLDWEMATIGDRRMDLGTTLAYHVDLEDPDDVKFLPLNLPPNEHTPTRRALVEKYADASGSDPGDMLFFYVYGLFKIAVVAQQIYYRYKTGKTNDERFSMMILGVHALSGQGSASTRKK